MSIDTLQNLSLSDLLSGPLVAAIDASLHAQTESVRLLREVGYDRNGELQTVTFGYETSEIDSASGEAQRARRELEIPLLLFLSLPNLQVSEIEEEFSARITQVEEEERDTTNTGRFATNRLLVSPAERSTSLDRTTRSRFHLDVRMVAELQNQSPGMELLERAANAAVREHESRNPDEIRQVRDIESSRTRRIASLNQQRMAEREQKEEDQEPSDE